LWKGYTSKSQREHIYFAMGFSIFVELLNLRLRKAHAMPVKLHQRYVSEAAQGLAPARDDVQE
jgi:hypothetical protein